MPIHRRASDASIFGNNITCHIFYKLTTRSTRRRRGGSTRRAFAAPDPFNGTKVACGACWHRGCVVRRRESKDLAAPITRTRNNRNDDFDHRSATTREIPRKRPACVRRPRILPEHLAQLVPARGDTRPHDDRARHRDSAAPERTRRPVLAMDEDGDGPHRGTVPHRDRLRRLPRATAAARHRDAQGAPARARGSGRAAPPPLQSHSRAQQHQPDHQRRDEPAEHLRSDHDNLRRDLLLLSRFPHAVRRGEEGDRRPLGMRARNIPT